MPQPPKDPAAHPPQPERHRPIFEDAEGQTAEEIPMGLEAGSMTTGGTGGETRLTIEQAMAGDASAGEQGGSGGTGGRVTGEATEGGETLDLTEGIASGGGHVGGPTGGDLTGGGSGGLPDLDTLADHAEGGPVRGPQGIAFQQEPTGMRERVMAANDRERFGHPGPGEPEEEPLFLAGE